MGARSGLLGFVADHAAAFAIAVIAGGLGLWATIYVERVCPTSSDDYLCDLLPSARSADAQVSISAQPADASHPDATSSLSTSESPGDESTYATIQAIAAGSWVQGTWQTPESDAFENIALRIRSSGTFRTDDYHGRAEIVSVPGGKAIAVNGQAISPTFKGAYLLKHGSNRGWDKVAAIVELSDGRFTVAVNGETWNTSFEEVFGWPVIDKRTAIAVRTSAGWTIAADGTPWSSTYDGVMNYQTYPNGATVAEVRDDDNSYFVMDGIELTTIKTYAEFQSLAIGERGTAVWVSKEGDLFTVKTGGGGWTTRFSNSPPVIVGEAGQVVAATHRGTGTTLVVDDVFWENDFRGELDRFGTCGSSEYLVTTFQGGLTMVVNEAEWRIQFDELGALACELPRGRVSAAIKVNGLWAIARDGRIVSDWYKDLRGWAISEEGSMLAVAGLPAETHSEWSVVVSSLNTW